jgi:hypothetical protein
MNQNQPVVKMSVIKALGWSLLLCIIIGGLGTMFAYEPTFKGTPILGLFTVWSCTLIIGIVGFLNGRKKRWQTMLIFALCVMFLLLANAFHFLAPLISGWLWKIVLLGMFILAWTLPLIDLTLAKELNDEQFAPRTWIGKHLVQLLFLFTFLGFIVIGVIDRTSDAFLHSREISIGIFSAFVAIGGSQTLSYQVKRFYDAEQQKKKLSSAQHAASSDLAKAQQAND